MDNRYAVMDLGTNTFHLLIAEGSIADFHILIHEHIAVKIGEGGINKGVITEAAFRRGLNTMKNFGDAHEQCVGLSNSRLDDSPGDGLIRSQAAVHCHLTIGQFSRRAMEAMPRIGFTTVG